MSTVEQLWDRVRPILNDLRLDCVARPDVPWHVRREPLLDGLGSGGADQGVAAGMLVDHLDRLSDEERHRLIGHDELEVVAYEIVRRCAVDEGFAWVRDDQRAALESVWGPCWQEPLDADLNALWGDGWRAHPDEHKAMWLAEILATTRQTQAPPLRSEARRSPDRERVLDELADIARQVPGSDRLSLEQIADVIAELVRESERSA